MIAARLGDKKSTERLVQAKADILIGDQVLNVGFDYLIF